MMEIIKLTLDIKSIELLQSIFPNGVVFFDLETTGLSPATDSIVEIGAVKVSKSEVKCYQTLVNPGHPIPELATSIHHIDDQMVAESPTLAEVIDELMDFFEDLPIFAHNAQFDIGFVTTALFKNKRPIPTKVIYDSCRLARKALGTNQVRLSLLSEQFQLPSFNHHRALDDAIACMQVVAKIYETCPRYRNRFWGRLGVWSDYQDPSSVTFPEHLQDKFPILLKKDTVEILYLGGTKNKNSWRKVEPLGIMPMPSGLMLRAKCAIDNTNKFFSLQKIKDAREYLP